ncbi:MAG: FecR domain-containing protein [Vitreoscilla sp.]|nr:FecR domain-containing protein [Vitreoscilla sp.]
MKAALALLAGAALAGMAAAAPAITEPVLDYTVVAGDTLIGRGNTLLRSPAAWREVARLNRLANPNLILPGQRLRIPLRLLRAEPAPARLASAEGDIRIDGLPAAAGAALAPGQRLSAAERSSAVLVLGDASRVVLAPGSETQLTEHQRYAVAPGPGAMGQQSDGVFASTMRLVRGGIEVLASKLARAKPLEVTTPTAVIGVRGTRYRVRLDGDTATGTEVLAGTVQADPVGAPGVAIPGGHGARLLAGVLPKVVALPAAPDVGGIPARFERPLVRLALPGEPSAWRVQVAADPSFERVVRDERVGAGAEARIAGLDDGAWHLRVRRIDAQGIEGFDARHAFTLKARPEPPALSAPPARAKLAAGPVDLAWAANLEAASYRVEVAQDAGFRHIVQRWSDLPVPRATLPAAEPGSYHWRVASVRAGGDAGPWGDGQHFELRPVPTPPQGGVSADGKQVELRWEGRAEDKQQVELARDAAFTDVVARVDLGEARWAQPTPAQPGRYFFRYRAIEPDGFTTPWSSTLAIEVPRDWRVLWLLAPFLLAL